MIEKLIVYPTFNCNMRCSYCFYRKNNTEYLTFNNFKKAFKKFLKISINPSIAFLGGEALLNKKLLVKFIKHIKKIKKEMPVIIFSNGTLLDRKIVKFIKNNKIKLIISIDGPKDINDKMRIYYKSSFESAFSNLKKYKLIDKVTVNMAVNKNNIKNLSNNVKYLYDTGFRKIGWNINYADNWEINDIKTIKKQIKKVFLDYLKLIKNKKEIYEISNRYEIMDFLIKKEKNVCKNLILYPDSKFYLCDKVINSKKLLLKNDIIGEREKIFKKFSRKYPQKGLFCPLGIYFYLRYEKKFSPEIIRRKLNIIYSIMSIIEKNTIKFFKILLKYGDFRLKHNL